MKKTLIPSWYRTMTVYKVCGYIANKTNAELIDFCDINNFGGYVKRYNDYCAYVTVNID